MIDARCDRPSHSHARGITLSKHVPGVFAVVMLCTACHRQVPRRAPFCPSCGAARRGVGGVFDLVLGDGLRVPVVRELSIGRAPGNTLELADPSVSRVHARVSPARNGGSPMLQDLGSSSGTWVDGHRLDRPRTLRDGARIRLGDEELVVRRRRSDSEAGRTVLVPPGASLVLAASGDAAAVESAETQFGARPRLRSGYALKRLDAAEGTRRWVVKDLVGGRLARLTDADVRLLELLDGRHTIPELVTEAERRLGSAGPARLARLLADLGARGLLAGATASESRAVDAGRLQRLFRPRRLTTANAGDAFDRAYTRGGWLLFTLPARGAIAITAAAGLAAFAYLIGARYGTPFVVANKLALGGLVFLLGRLAVAAVHEAAHGLTMASFGRRVSEAGLKLILVFPYVFVNTSDAWFEPRRRRIAVSAAGPISDLTLGGAFAICCLVMPAGTTRDVVFQLAFGAYLGALLNLNPLLDRDGYHILVDVLREPGLRGRALEQLRLRLAGRRVAHSRLLTRYALLALAWTVVAAVCAAAFSLRYQSALAAIVPGAAVWTLLAVMWLALLALPLAIVVPPLRQRRAART